MTDYSGNDRKVSATAVLILIGVVFGSLAVFLVAIAYSPHGFDSNATPVIVSVIAMVPPTIAAAFALLRVDQTRQELHNGLIPAKVHDAVKAGVVEGTLAVKVDRDGAQERVDDPPAPV